MFKSSFRRIPGPVLIFFFMVPGAGAQDSIPPGSAPVSESLMEYLDSPTFNRMLDRAILYQKRADSLERLAIEWRKETVGMDDPLERGRLQGRIVRVEDSVNIYSMLADEHFNYLNTNIPEEKAEIPRHPFLVRDTVRNGITVYHYNLTGEFMDRLALIRETPPATQPGAGAGQDVAGSKDPAGGADAAAQEASQTLKAAAFAVLDASPYGPEEPFEQDFPIPPGVFYRIQLAVYSKEPGPGQFGGLSPITTESIPDRGMTRYFVGKFSRMEEAKTALLKVRALGYPDAFIIGYYNGVKSSFSKLKALEK